MSRRIATTAALVALSGGLMVGVWAVRRQIEPHSSSLPGTSPGAPRGDGAPPSRSSEGGPATADGSSEPKAAPGPRPDASKPDSLLSRLLGAADESEWERIVAEEQKRTGRTLTESIRAVLESSFPADKQRLGGWLLGRLARDGGPEGRELVLALMARGDDVLGFPHRAAIFSEVLRPYCSPEVGDCAARKLKSQWEEGRSSRRELEGYLVLASRSRAPAARELVRGWIDLKRPEDEVIRRLGVRGLAEDGSVEAMRLLAERGLVADVGSEGTAALVAVIRAERTLSELVRMLEEGRGSPRMRDLCNLFGRVGGAEAVAVLEREYRAGYVDEALEGLKVLAGVGAADPVAGFPRTAIADALGSEETRRRQSAAYAVAGNPLYHTEELREAVRGAISREKDESLARDLRRALEKSLGRVEGRTPK